MRVLIDTNVFVAALLRSASCREILEAFRGGAFTLITSEELVSELTEVLRRPKFSGCFSTADRAELIELIRRDGCFVTPKDSSVEVRDPKDRPVLNCAYASDIIVSGDNDIKILKSIGRTTVLSPSAFLSRLKRRGRISS